MFELCYGVFHLYIKHEVPLYHNRKFNLRQFCFFLAQISLKHWISVSQLSNCKFFKIPLALCIEFKYNAFLMQI